MKMVPRRPAAAEQGDGNMVDWWKKLTGELIDIVEAPAESRGTLVSKFERYQNEIKNGAQLIVREGQVAVFVDQGRLADVFQPGRHVLSTSNLPILSTLRGWKYGFESPFKAEVYFVTTTQFTDMKWGTMNPIMRRDPEFGPVRLRAFGTYAFRVTDAGSLIKEIVGPSAHFTTDGIMEQLRNIIVSRFSDKLGEASIPMLDLAGKYDELAETIAAKIKPEFQGYGLEITKLLIENVSLPPEVETALDRRSSMGIVGNLQGYTQMAAADALLAAAKNPGAAGQTMGVGLGVLMGQQVGGAAVAAGGMAPPPPLPTAAGFYVAVNGAQAGPFDATGLAGLAREGKLGRDTLVWRQGMAGWAAAGTVSDLGGVLGATPPPLP
jgi:membrane protease subunit (stomatin/prohibitin family)